MSWWKKVFGSKAAESTTEGGPVEAAEPAAEAAEPAPAHAGQFPVTVEIIAGELSARVYLHEITSAKGRIPCWSYVSDGLRAHQHKEVVFTLRRKRDEADDAFPEDPLQLFGTLYRVAAQGQRVTEGGCTELGAKRFFEHHLLYADAQPLDDVTLPPGCLVALLINDDELRAVRQFGCTRVLGRMGQAVTHYPFQTWSERGRRGLALASTFEHSLVAKVGIRVGGHIVASLHDNRITLGVLRALHASWREELSKLPDGPIAFLTLRDPAANACLVWVPGQSEPTAISPVGSDGSRVSGCCVVVLGEQPGNGGKLFEDGFAIELTDASWAELRRALVEGQDLVIPATNGGKDFALIWRDVIYPDDRLPVAPGAGSLAVSQGESARDRIALDQVRLLTAEADMASRASSRDLAAFCMAVRACAERTLGDHGGPLEAVMVRFTCTANGHRFDLAHKGQAPRTALQAFHEGVEQLARLPVRSGKVAFEVYLKASAPPS